MRFNVNYFVGSNLRNAIIEARNLEDAEQKANHLFKSWVDLVYADISNAMPAWAER